MAATSMSDTACRTAPPGSRINHWVYESIPGQICGRDGEGRVLVEIAADAGFAARLVAAFNAGDTAPVAAAGVMTRPAFPR